MNEKFSYDPNLTTDESQQTKKNTQEPCLYKVIMHNDDYTPMAFVVSILQIVFQKNEQESTELMLEIHTKGSGVCGIYPYEVAHTKVVQIEQLAEQNEHPLRCTMEEIEPS